MLEYFIKVLSCHLNSKQWRKYYHKIVFNLYCVNKGYKPSFLWDVGPALLVDTLRKLIEDLKFASLLNPHIYLVLIKEEKFIVNIETLFWFFGNFLNEIKIVNCNSKLDKPIVMLSDEYKDLFTFNFVKDKICDIIKSPKNSTRQDVILSLDFDENLMQCPPTVFGIMIGYPVVYWDDNILNSNGLINIPLNVYNVQINDPTIPVINKDYNLYSFSVPTCLDLDEFVNNWLNILSKTNGVVYRLRKSTVFNPCVQL